MHFTNVKPTFCMQKMHFTKLKCMSGWLKTAVKNVKSIFCMQEMRFVNIEGILSGREVLSKKLNRVFSSPTEISKNVKPIFSGPEAYSIKRILRRTLQIQVRPVFLCPIGKSLQGFEFVGITGSATTQVFEHRRTRSSDGERAF